MFIEEKESAEYCPCGAEKCCGAIRQALIEERMQMELSALWVALAVTTLVTGLICIMLTTAIVYG